MSAALLFGIVVGGFSLALATGAAASPISAAPHAVNPLLDADPANGIVAETQADRAARISAEIIDLQHEIDTAKVFTIKGGDSTNIDALKVRLAQLQESLAQ